VRHSERVAAWHGLPAVTTTVCEHPRVASLARGRPDTDDGAPSSRLCQHTVARTMPPVFDAAYSTEP
jgi:hypothetical protein